MEAVRRNNNNYKKNSSPHLLSVNYTKFTIVKHEKEVGLKHGKHDSTGSTARVRGGFLCFLLGWSVAQYWLGVGGSEGDAVRMSPVSSISN